ncbi:MAG: shikimate kinase [Candidatus Symbiobacter sp.]|nr:shikimate kinase [Candidatus Symbiobacter sp.]
MSPSPDPIPPAPPSPLPYPVFAVPKSLVLVGMMGAGKSAVGRHIAAWLGWPFRDSDVEIEQLFGMTTSEIFKRYDEARFRSEEKKVMCDLLVADKMVIASGGGAFINPDTRAAVKQAAISIWLDVPMDELMRRVLRRATRPLLQQPNPREIMEKLLAERRPIYSQADLVVESDHSPSIITAERVVRQLQEYLAAKEKS